MRDRTAVARRPTTIDSDTYPYLNEHMGEHVALSKREGGEGEFEFGLDLILDGLKRIRPRD